MLYIIGWGVFVLIAVRIFQAGFADNPKAARAIGFAGLAIGIAFCGWLASHWYLHEADPPKPKGSIQF